MLSLHAGNMSASDNLENSKSSKLNSKLIESLGLLNVLCVTNLICTGFSASILISRKTDLLV